MKQNNLLKRFYQYQKERFPFAILIFTTSSVVLSSAAIVTRDLSSFSELLLPLIIATITCLFFMLNIRVFDDSKDEDFDEKFHKKRPVQRGLISLKELNLINTVSMSLQFIINAFFSLAATFWWVISLCYSLLAKYEFFCKSFIRKQFMLYNFLNLMQMFFLQIYIYYLINPNLSFADPLLLIHFIFVLSNAMILEVARKLKGKREISKGLDTYSSRYGIKQSAYLYMSSYSITYLLFLYIFIKVGFSLIILLISFISLLVITYSTIRYVITQTKASTKIIEIVAIAYYLSMHLLLMGAALV